MILSVSLAAVVAAALWVVVGRWRRARRDRQDWSALAARFPASASPYDGRRYTYPSSGDAVIGADGFRAQPDRSLPAIEVPWSSVRSVQSGATGGVEIHVPGGVVVLPGAASAAVAEVIAERARRRQTA